MSAHMELVKLEAMYYHAREPKHIKFLKTHELYAVSRTVNTFKAGKEIVEGHTVVRHSDR
jgi:hypothetical protein